MARKRRPRGWRALYADPAPIGPMLRAAGFVGSAGDPTSVRASFDADGRLRRVHARYGDGWCCTMRLSLDDSYTLTQSIRLRVSGRMGGRDPSLSASVAPHREVPL